MSGAGRAVGELREPGEQLAPGSHVCCVVDSAEELERWAIGYLAEGANMGEKLFRFGPQSGLPGAPEGLTVTTADPRVALLQEGPVNPAVIFAMFRREAHSAKREGHSGLRVVADMDWVLAVPPTRAELAAFELLLDEVVAELGATVVCVYRREHFDEPTMAEIVAVHPLTVGRADSDPGFRLWNVTGGVWAVRGEIDYLNAEPFGRALTAAANAKSLLHLKAAALRFVAVAGVDAVAQVAFARPDLRLIIEDANDLFRQCWDLLGLDQQLPMVEFRSTSAAGVAR